MGFVTIVRLYNDHASELLDYPKKFCNYLHRMLAGSKSGRILNIAKVFPSISSNSDSIYVLNGGEAFEMSKYSEETRRLIEQNPEAFASNLRLLRTEVRSLEKMFRERKAEKNKK
jgi:hypothetical protein